MAMLGYRCGHVLGLALLAIAAPVLAQEQPLTPANELPPTEPEVTPADLPTERPIRFSFTARGHLGFNTEFDDSPGDLSISRIGGEFGVELPAGERGSLTLGLDYEFSHYDFTDATGFIEGTDRPFEDIYRTFFSARYARQQTRQLVWLVGGSVGVSAEDGAELSDSITGMLFGGAKFYLNEQLAVGLGAAVATQLEDSPTFFPMPMIEWHFAERWSLVSGSRPGLSLVYTPTDQIKIALGASYEHRNFRLSEDGPLPGGVALERQFPISLGIEFSPTPQLQLGLTGGVAVARNFEVKDEDGDEVADIDADPAAFLGLQFVYRF